MRSLALTVLAALLAGPAAAQQVRLEAPRGVLYAATPIELVITAEGFEESPEPEVSVTPPASGQLELIGVSPNVSSQISIINGEVTQTKEVRFVYRYRYRTAEPGSTEIGPFVITQNQLTRSTAAIRLEIREVPESDRLRVELLVPDGPRYVGQRVPVTLELWLEAALRENLASYALRAPLFDLAESFRFGDEPDAEGDTELALETAAGTLRLRGTLRVAEDRGQSFVVVSVRRTLVALRPGRYTLAPATAVVDEATRWERGLFGGRRATRMRKLRAADRERTLEILPVPTEGKPKSFAGAVGRGYALEVTADRSVVRVGDPIKLRLTLRGEGELEAARLPPLDAFGLLPASAFRVPEGDLPGELDAGAKHFTAVVRVLDPEVREIPALAYSWFDAEAESYQTTHSRPIALSVSPAERVGAEHVFSASRSPSASGAETGPSTAERGDAAGSAFALTGADLAIERDPEVLLGERGRAPGGLWAPGALYAAALLAVLAAWIDRRRRELDPAVARRRRELGRELERIREASALPPDEAVRQLAQALRRMMAAVPHAAHERLEGFLSECDARSYAPGGGDGAAALDEAFRARALELGRAIAEQAR